MDNETLFKILYILFVLFYFLASVFVMLKLIKHFMSLEKLNEPCHKNEPVETFETNPVGANEQIADCDDGKCYYYTVVNFEDSIE